MITELLRRGVCPGCGERFELGLEAPAGEPDAAAEQACELAGAAASCISCRAQLRSVTVQELLGDDYPSARFSPMLPPGGPVEIRAWQWFLHLGRDFNGRPLVSDQYVVLDREGLSGGESDAYIELFNALSGAVAQHREENRT